MDLVEIYCRKCGGTLERISEEQYKCAHCRSVFYEDHLKREIQMLNNILDTAKQEKLSNLRRLLWTELKKEYTNSEEIISYCKEIKKLYPEDYYANLYSVLNGGSDAEVNEFLDKTNAVEYSEDIPDILSFMLKSLKSANLISVADLIERAYGSDRGQYEKYMTEFEAEAEKVEQGVYDPSFPRDVFVMYSSADMPKVKSLTGYLEEQGITCFVAARNLQHGRGAVANYQKSLETALDNCKSIVFVSSKNSRSLKCDAIRLEIPYVQKKDFLNAPGHLRNRYDTLPEKYKKPRVEYVIDSYTGKNAVERISKEFFGTLQWAQSEDAVAERVIKILSGTPTVDEAELQRKKEAEEAEARRKAEIEELKHTFEEQLEKVGRANSAPIVNASTVGGTNTAALMKRAILALEDGEFAKADGFCEKVLNIDAENAEAYLGKLMAELQVRSKEKLKDCPKVFISNNNYQKVMRFGGEELKKELKGYIEYIKTRNEAERVEGIYKQAYAAFNSARYEKEYRVASELFNSIPKYKDASSLATECFKKAEEERRKVEEAKRKAEEERKKVEEAKRKAEEERQERIYSAAIATAENSESITALKNAIASLSTLSNYKNSNQLIDKYQEKILLIHKEEKARREKERLAEELQRKKTAARLEEEKRRAAEIEQEEQQAAEKKHRHQVVGVRILIIVILFALFVIPALIAYSSSNESSGSSYKPSSGTPKPSTSNQNGTGSGSGNESLLLKDVKIGDYIKFGSYEQDNVTSNGKEAIEWLVLDIKDNKALVISKYELDCKKYNNAKTNVTWETCTLRTWLNNDFTNTAFTASEKAMIPTVTVSADQNPKYSTSSGNATQDKIFALSITEVNKYFTSNDARKCTPTAYAKAKGAYSNGTSGSCWWWLRSPGYNQTYAALIELNGSVDTYGCLVNDALDNQYNAVRPAMWIELPTVENDSATELSMFEYEKTSTGYTILGIKDKTVKSIIIPDGVTKIENYAFQWCNALTSITIPDSVTTIGYGWVIHCNKLTQISVSSENTVYKDINGNVYSKDGKTLIQYATGKTETNFIIPDAVTSIALYAFRTCSIAGITIHNGVTSIPTYTFEDCANLTTISVSSENSNYKDIDGNLYTKEGKTLIQYAIGKTDESFVLPDTVTKIGPFAFGSCNNLTSITISNSVTTIESSAFQSCIKLANVVIGNSVTKIGDSAFAYCDGLINITIPQSVTSIGLGILRGCDNLTNITVSNENSKYVDIDGNLYTKDGKTLIQYAAGKKETNFTIPDTVTKIEYMAFEGSDKLQNVTIPNSVIAMEFGVFWECNSLASVVIPDSVTLIGDYAFNTCDNLTSVVIGNSVTSIGSNAFDDCSALTSIKYRGTETQWNAISKGSGWKPSSATITYNYTGE